MSQSKDKTQDEKAKATPIGARLDFPKISNRELKILLDARNDAQKILNSIPKAFRESLPKINAQLNQLSKADAALSDFFRTIGNFNLGQMISPALQQIARTQMLAMEMADTMRKTFDESSKILSELGWWIYPDWGMRNLADFIQAHKEGKDEEIEQAVLDYFDDKKLDDMVASWKSNPALKSRMHILEDAVWAHKQGKRTLSIPAFLPQIEGMIFENAGKRGQVKQKEIIEYLKKQIAKDLDASRAIAFALSNPVVSYIEGLVGEKFEWGQTNKPKGGRNPILHGFFVDYADKKSSLKLILLVDFLHEAFRKQRQ